MSRYLTALIIVLVTAIGIHAQDTVTQDDVDEVTSKMVCPVCENEPLDQCYNPTCIQWKREIRDLMEQGLTNDEILASFVERYGQHVVMVPRDPFLRFLSFGAPIIGTLIALAIGLMTFMRWRNNQPSTSSVEQYDEKPKHADSYRSQIERDLG
ncbi:MAG: cytochrome c-type biogenesis protein CcmH [Chloroflexota bacterium]